MTKSILRSLALIAFFTTSLVACDSNDPQPEPLDFPHRTVADADYTVTASGLKYFDFVVGDSTMAEEGNIVTVHYTGWLETGQIFDTSLLGAPVSFPLRSGSLIEGWVEGVAGMKIGGERQLVIPPSLGYGSSGTGSIPPNATLIFEIELLGVSGGSASQ